MADSPIGNKRRPTDLGPGVGTPTPDEATRAMPAVDPHGSADDTTLRQMDAASRAAEGTGGDKSEPRGVVGPVTKRHRTTAPYLQSQPEIPIKAKKSLPRRILKWVGWTLVGLLVLILLAIGFFHTGPGKDIARGLVEGALAKRFDGDVSLGGLDYAIFGDVELKDLKIAEKGGGRTVIHLEHLLLDLDWGSLLSKPLTIEALAIDGLTLDLVGYPDGTTNLRRMQKEQSKLPEQLVVQALSLSRVNFSIERGEGDQKSRFAVTDLTMLGGLALDNPNRKTSAELTKLTLTANIVRPGLTAKVPVDATLSALLDGDVATLKLVARPATATVMRGDQRLDVPVSLGVVDAGLRGKAVTFALAASTLGPFSLERLAASGTLPAPGTLPKDPVLVELVGGKLDHVAANALLGRPLLASDVGLEASVKGPLDALVIAGDVTTAGGNLGLTGRANVMNPLEPDYQVKLIGTDLDTSKLLAGNSPQSMRSAFTLTLTGKGLPPTGQARLDLDVDKTIVSQTAPDGSVTLRTLEGMTLDATTAGPVITVEGLVVKAFGQTLTLDGGVDRDTREVRATLKMTSRLSDAIARAREDGVLITPLPPIEGEVDVDLALNARLKTPEQLAELRAAAAEGPLLLSKLPFDALTVKGVVRGTDVKVLDRQLGSITTDVDIVADERGPAGMKGKVATRIAGLDAGTLHLDSLDLEVLLDGFTQQIGLAVRDERQALNADVAIKSVLDLERRHVDATFEKVEVERGAFSTKLLAPFTVGIDQPRGGPQRLSVPPVKLALAGGTLGLTSQVDLVPDPDKPGANKLERFDATIDLDKVDLQQLAALAKRSTRGLSGRLTGTLHAQGRPDDPQVELVGALRGRMKGGEPITTKLDVTLRDKILDARVAVVDKKNKPVFELDARAPITLPPPGSGAKPGLAPGGRLSVEAELFETTLGRLAALTNNPALSAMDPDATLGLRLAMNGTTSRPTGTWSLSFLGDMLRRRGYERAPARQKLEVSGTMGRGVAPTSTAIANTLTVWLDASGAPLLAHELNADLSRSPLLRDPLSAPWTLNAALSRTLDLSALTAAGLTDKALSGIIAQKTALRGQGQDVLGVLALDVSNARVGNAPPVDMTLTTHLHEDHIAHADRVKVAGLEALTVDARINLPGRGLRAAVKVKDRVASTAITGEVILVERLIADWKSALGELGVKVPALPGHVGGKLTLGGTVGVPTAEGAFAWQGFDTVSGQPGRVALALSAKDTLSGGLELGPARDVRMLASVARSSLRPPDPNKPPLPLPVALSMSASGVDVRDLVPAFVLQKPGATPADISKVKPLDFRGKLDWDMKGTALLERDPVAKLVKPLAAGSQLLGHMTISDLDIAVPDTDRHFRDGVLKVEATPEALSLSRLSMREADVQRDDRSVLVTARLPWADLKPSAATLSVKTHEWLVLGLGFDGPEGELDLDLDIAVTDLDKPVKAVDVTVNGMQLNAPDRFIRAHYPQFPAYDDLIYVSSDQPSGRLPYKAPPAAASTVADPNAGFDVKLRIPEPIHVIFAAASPLEIKLEGGMDVAMRGANLDLRGRLDVTYGVLGAMGRDFKLVHGAITAGGGLDSALAELVFAAHPSDVALRDVAEGEHGDVATITIRASAKTGMQTIFGGVSGPYLLDMATFLNTGRGRLWGEPDVASSETVRFGNPDQGLVNTFVQTNLRNLIFMDRANGWSTSQADPSQYGRLRNFDMQRFLPPADPSRAPGQRIRFTAQPLNAGIGPFVLGYDWLLVSEPRAVLGFGPFVDFDLRAGLGLSLEWSSRR